MSRIKSHFGVLLNFDRLGISYPELSEMQVRAIFQAAISMTNQGISVLPEIMVPLIGTPQVCHFIFFPYFVVIVNKKYKSYKISQNNK